MVWELGEGGGGVTYREYIFEEPRISAVVLISSTFPLPSASTGRLHSERKTRREVRIVDIVTAEEGGEGAK